MNGGSNDWELSGSPSDLVPEILATGDSGVTKLFLSLSKRHPEGDDARYLHWHSMDHRPEQYRLQDILASLRIVSTPACRQARAASDARLDAADHVMTYFFRDSGGLRDFGQLSDALRNAGRSPFILPPVERGVFAVEGRAAAPRAMAGADVLPWRPAKGVYLLIENGQKPALDLLEIPGVAGLWSTRSETSPASSLEAGLQLTYCFLDDDPVETAQRLRPVLEARWQDADLTPLLAAPYHCIVPFEWDKYLP